MQNYTLKLWRKNMEEKVKKENLENYLNAVYQNIKTAVQSIDDLLPKVKDDNLKKELASQQDKYLALQKECEVLAQAEKLEKIKDNNWLEKARLWSSINLSTLTNKTTRHIAEMMLFGTFMGYITCVKDLSDHRNISKEVDEILTKLKEFERGNIDSLMPYLV